MPFPIRADKRQEYVRGSATPELLDAVTVFRDHLDPDAADQMLAELASRGVGPDDVAAHGRDLRWRVVEGRRGLPAVCDRCRRAATASRVGWHKLWGRVPLFRRTQFTCDEHAQGW